MRGAKAGGCCYVKIECASSVPHIRYARGVRQHYHSIVDLDGRLSLQFTLVWHWSMLESIGDVDIMLEVDRPRGVTSSPLVLGCL